MQLPYRVNLQEIVSGADWLDSFCASKRHYPAAEDTVVCVDRFTPVLDGAVSKHLRDG